jgi:hypothetical protein
MRLSTTQRDYARVVTSVRALPESRRPERLGALENYGAVHIFDVSDGTITRFREFVA